MSALRTATLILLLIPAAFGFLLVLAGLTVVGACRELAKAVAP